MVLQDTPRLRFVPFVEEPRLGRKGRGRIRFETIRCRGDEGDGNPPTGRGSRFPQRTEIIDYVRG